MKVNRFDNSRNTEKHRNMPRRCRMASKDGGEKHRNGRTKPDNNQLMHNGIDPRNRLPMLALQREKMRHRKKPQPTQRLHKTVQQRRTTGKILKIQRHTQKMGINRENQSPIPRTNLQPERCKSGDQADKKIPQQMHQTSTQRKQPTPITPPNNYNNSLNSPLV